MLSMTNSVDEQVDVDGDFQTFVWREKRFKITEHIANYLISQLNELFGKKRNLCRLIHCFAFVFNLRLINL